MGIIMESFDQEKYNRARKRVQEIKSFYIHLAVYIIINAFILINIYIHTLDGGEFWQVGHFFTLFFWGIGLAFHAISAFKYNPLFGKRWEERQIRKLMDKDRDQSQKYQ